MSFAELFSFEGRVNRAKFWGVQLVIGFFLVGLAIFDNVLFGESAGILYLIGFLITLIPLLANQVKRWHDRGKSGLWVFIAFIPIIGSIWVFIETGFLRGTDGPNKFGPDPLNPEKSVESIIDSVDDNEIWDTEILKDAEKGNS